MTGAFSFSRTVEICRIGTAGIVETVEANETERAELAAALGLITLRSLSAEMSLNRIGRAIIAVDGRLRADIVQTCVISLVELEQHVDELFSLRFIEEAQAVHMESGHEIRIDPDEADPPEALSGPVLDLGSVVVEQLTLAIDPYPRAPGAVLPDSVADAPEDSSESPFAELAALKDRG